MAINTSNDDEARPMVTTDPVDHEKVSRYVIWFKKQIDADQIEEHYWSVQDTWRYLNNNERMAIDEQLRDKAPDSNKMYKNLLKEYLAYVPQ